jgi:hypothetical protein
MPDYVDYMILNLWAGNWDWPWNNYWIARDRTPASRGFQFYCWDTEDVMLSSRSPLTMDKVTNPDASDVGQPHSLLVRNAEYRLFFADRVHRFFFNDGLLTANSLVKRYADLAGRVELAVVTECARWGDQFGRSITPQQWVAKRDTILNTYLQASVPSNARSARVLQQFRNAGLYPNVAAPEFKIDGAYQHGGHVATGAALSMEAPAGTIWYTLDGTDPRVAGVSNATSITLVAENAAKKVLVPTAPISDAWRGGATFDDSAWTSGTGGVGYERSTGYESFFRIDVGAEMYQKYTSCCLRIPFTVVAEDMVYVNTLMLNVRYDDGFVAYINGSEVARRNCDGTPVWNSHASATNSDVSAVDLEPFDITAYAKKFVDGQNMLAIQGLNESTTSSDFLISVELKALAGSGGSNPSGVSPTALPYTAPVTLSAGVTAKARVLSASTWSALNEAVYAVGPVAQNLRISEIMYHPLDPNTEYVELTNIGATTINLNLVKFTQGIDFTFSNLELAPQAYTVVVEDRAAFQARYGASVPVAGRYAGSLSNGGERITLCDAAGQVIESFRYSDYWYDLTDGRGYSLTVNAPGEGDPNALSDKSPWRPSAEGGGSPGYDDSGLVP